MTALDYLKTRRAQMERDHPRSVSGQFAKREAIKELDRDIHQLEQEQVRAIVRFTPLSERV